MSLILLHFALVCTCLAIGLHTAPDAKRLERRLRLFLGSNRAD